MFRVSLLVLGVLGLTACATTSQDIGIPEDQWQKFDKSKQEKLVEDYEKLMETNKLEDQRVSDQYQQLKDNAYVGSYLQVKLYNGEAMMPPFTDWYHFKKATFEIIPNTCTNVLLEEKSEASDAKNVSMRACFADNVLFLDPSRFEANKNKGTVRFSASPLWNLGFTYRNINTNGYVHLKDVFVEIKKM